MKLYQYFLKTRKDLKILLLIALATYFLIELVLNNYSELFLGANKFGEFFSKISTSYISAFIFYFIVVHIKNEKDKENINEYVGHKVYSIITSAHLIITPFLRKTEPKAHFKYLNSSELNKLLSSINRLDKEAPFISNGEHTNWIEWLEYLKKSKLKSIKEIYARYNHVDTKLIKILTRIENSLYITQFDFLYSLNMIKLLGSIVFKLKLY